jgi:hypothetical protein
MPDVLAGNLTNNLLRKLRDPDATGLTHDFVRQMLSESQRFVNAGFRRMKETVALTTNPNQQFYNITALLPDAIRIENVREGGRDLRKTTLKALTQISTKFHREVGDSFRHFALVGRDLLVVYPSKTTESSVDVVYTRLTTELVNDDIAIEIPDDDMVQASDLAQIIMLTKMREFGMLKPILAQFTERAGKMIQGA